MAKSSSDKANLKLIILRLLTIGIITQFLITSGTVDNGASAEDKPYLLAIILALLLTATFDKYIVRLAKRIK